MYHLRFAFRQLVKSPGFTAVAVITLALGIGVNTTIFSLLDAVIYRMPPFREQDRVVTLTATTAGHLRGGLSLANIRDIGEQNSVLEDIATYNYFTPSLSLPGSPPEKINAFGVSGSFFKILGVNPLMGRYLSAEETLEGKNDVIVVSEDFWRHKLAGKADVIGSTVRLEGTAVTIVGVMPASFKEQRWHGCDLWQGSAWKGTDWANREGYDWMKVVSRLRPGVSVRQAQLQMDTIARRLAHDYPKTNDHLGVHLEPIEAYRSRYGNQGLWVYMGLTLLVLLIACTNLAALQLSRTAQRTYEHAIRIALGASRGQLIQLLLSESVLLSLVGGALGLLVAYWGNMLLGKGLGEELDINYRVGGFALFASVATGIGFGLTPAWSASRTDVNETLKQGVKGATADRSRHSLRNALVVCELSLALGLLAGASFFVRGMQRYSQAPTDLGWKYDGILTGSFMLSYTTYTNDAQTAAAIDKVKAALSAIPGVDRVAIGGSLPVFSLASGELFQVEGQPPPPKDRMSYMGTDQVTPGFFSTVGMKILGGRDFTADDRTDSAHVVIISSKMARKFWPKGDAIGHRIGSLDPGKPDWRQIVGVVNDVKFPGIPEGFQGQYQTYHPVTQDLNQHWLVFALHCNVPPGTLTLTARRAVGKADPDLALSNVQTVDSALRDSRSGMYSIESILVSGAILGLLLAMIGIYAVIAHLVTQRTKEIGIRIALGAPLRAIFWLLMSNGVRLAAYGTGIGLLLAFALTRILDRKMPYIDGQDPFLILGLAGLLAVATLLASWLPALRATKVNPLEALRAE